MRFTALFTLGLMAALAVPTFATAGPNLVKTTRSKNLVKVTRAKAVAETNDSTLQPIRPEAGPADRYTIQAPDLTVEILAPTQEVGPALAKISNITRTDVTIPFDIHATLRPVHGTLRVPVTLSKTKLYSLAAGETVFVSVKPAVDYWPDVGGDYHLTVHVDRPNVVIEKNDHNNSDQLVFCPQDDGDCS